MKRVSFLETFSIRSESEDVRASDSHENHPVASSVHQQKKFSHLSSLENSSEDADADSTFINDERAPADPQIATLDTSRSSSDSEDDRLLPFTLDNSETEQPEPEEKSSCAQEESCQTPRLSTPDLKDLSLTGEFSLLSSSSPRGPLTRCLWTVITQIVLLRRSHPSLSPDNGPLEGNSRLLLNWRKMQNLWILADPRPLLHPFLSTLTHQVTQL